MKSLSVVLFCMLVFNAHGQKNNRLDSLLQLSYKQEKMNLVKTLNEISWEFRNSNADSAIIYGNKSLKIASSIKNKMGIASAFNSIAAAYEAKSMLDSAEIFHLKSLDLKIKINDTLGLADTYNNLGILFDTKGNYVKALENYFSALPIYDKYAKDLEKEAMVLINIGIVYKKQKEYSKALNYYQKALKIYKEGNFKVGEVITTGNIGSLLLAMKDYEKSISYCETAKSLYDSLGYHRYVPYMLVNIAIAKDSLRNHESALQDYLTCIESFKNDKNYYELTHAQIGLAQNYLKTNKSKKALIVLNEALKMAKDNGFKELEVKAYKYLAQAEAQEGNYDSAYSYYGNYASGKDSLFESEKTQTVFELEMRYETEKKEKEILSQRAILAEKELDLSKKNSYILGLIGLAAILSLLGILFYDQQKLKSKQLQKENELKDALIKIETQNRLREQRLRISRDLHDNIGSQLTFIISSIDNLKYAYQLPEKLSSKLKIISEFTTTTIYELRDTIWAMNKNEIYLDDLMTRISDFINKANNNLENVTFSFDSETKLSAEIKLSSVGGMNLYRIIQEATNNALKHADAQHINIKMRLVEQELEISIEDDGKGFNQKITKIGNGLNNLKKRANDMGAKLLIDSAIDKGTLVVLKVFLKENKYII